MRGTLKITQTWIDGATSWRRQLLLSMMLCLVATTMALAQEPRGAVSPQDLEAGKHIYTRKCAQCHGDDGKGDGPAAAEVFPKPRDFTRGVFKIRTTPSGAVPTDDDLFRAVTNGLPGSSMPAWNVLADRERWQVIYYLKTFSDKFQEPAPPPITIPKEVPASSESIARGQELFRDAECWQCHGDEGRGDGPSFPTLKDDWDQPIWPANLTKCWNFRGGNTTRDVFRTFMTGLGGTPMPSYADIFEPQQAWDLANYVHSLCRDRKVDLIVKGVFSSGELPADPDDPRWASAQGIDFPLVGQIIQDPRQFTPSIDAVTVKALYNTQELALLLSWDDRTASQPNGAEHTSEDALVVQWPVRLSEGTEKPYFIYGDTTRPVYLWQWRSSAEGFTELNATGFGTESAQPKESQSLKGTIAYNHGQYKMLVHRTLTTEDKNNDLMFEVGKFTPIAFSAWDGSNGETGNKRSISTWYFLYLEPAPSRAQFICPGIAVVVIAAVEMFFSRQSRRRRSQ